MGKPDIAIKNCLGDNRRFADLFNATIFGGKQVVLPENLRPAAGESDVIVQDKCKNNKAVQRYRDIVKIWDDEITLIVLACENQNKIHYGMPVRNMLYDALSYNDQMILKWKHITEEDKKILTADELFSRFRKKDTISPVITMVFYYGEKDWDGSTELYDMFGKLKNEEYVKCCVPNYRINLVNPSKICDLSGFRTDLQIVFDMLKYKNDKKKLIEYTNSNKYFEAVDTETMYAIAALLGAEQFVDDMIVQGQEEQNMCKALQDLYNDGIAEGVEQGIKALIETCLDFGESKEKTISRIREKFTVSEECLQEYISKYWR